MASSADSRSLEFSLSVFVPSARALSAEEHDAHRHDTRDGDIRGNPGSVASVETDCVSRAAVLRLPDELLSYILFLLMPPRWYDGAGIPLRNFLRLTQICSAWRNAALHDPRLWTIVPFTGESMAQSDHEATLRFLERSKQMPLVFHIPHRCTEYGVDLATRHISRTRSLHIRQVLDDEPTKALLSMPAPVLVSLRLGVKNGRFFETLASPLFSGNAPLLRFLTVYDCKGLDLADCAYRSLHTLSLSSVRLAPVPSPLILERLVDLQIRKMDGQFEMSVLRYLQTPSLESLKIDVFVQRHPAAFNSAGIVLSSVGYRRVDEDDGAEDDMFLLRASTSKTTDVGRRTWGKFVGALNIQLVGLSRDVDAARNAIAMALRYVAHLDPSTLVMRMDDVPVSADAWRNAFSPASRLRSVDAQSPDGPQSLCRVALLTALAGAEDGEPFLPQLRSLSLLGVYFSPMAPRAEESYSLLHCWLERDHHSAGCNRLEVHLVTCYGLRMADLDALRELAKTVSWSKPIVPRRPDNNGTDAYDLE